MSGVLGDCVVVARHALDIHEQRMKDLRGCKNDPFMVAKYINWCVDQSFQWHSSSWANSRSRPPPIMASYWPSGLTIALDRVILYCPFILFSILFTRVVQLLDIADLDRLDRLANSLQPGTTPPEVIIHPYWLYKLLCQATWLYFDLDTPSWPADPTIIHNLTDLWAKFDFAHSGVGTGATADETLEAGGPQTYGLYDWCQDSQQIMGLLSEDVMFWLSVMIWLPCLRSCVQDKGLAEAFTFRSLRA
jgi:hypothetical protein